MVIPSSNVQTIALIVAAGRGSRIGLDIPKQYQPLADQAVVLRTCEAFAKHPAIHRVQVVIHRDDDMLYQASMRAASPLLLQKLNPPVYGGQTRQESVRLGLQTINTDLVLVHDAARPFVSLDVISRGLEAVQRTGAALPCIMLSDTPVLLDEGGNTIDTPARDRFRLIQTPQIFSHHTLSEAHQRAAQQQKDFTDDGSLIRWAGTQPVLFEGDVKNIKITYMQDLAMAEHTLVTARTGLGYDVHRFQAGDHVWLGGVRIPHDRGVEAHSDGDVVLHALTDAILGALCDGDIGVHFPPSDAQWQGASSDRFLAFAAERVRARGGMIDHVDVMILLERPKIGAYRDTIRARIAEILNISVAQVSVKATTTEKLGFIGREEGLAAQCVVTVRV